MPLKNRGPLVPAADPALNGGSLTLPEQEAPVPPETPEAKPKPAKSADAEVPEVAATEDPVPVQERIIRTLDPSLVQGTMTSRGFVPKGHIEIVDCDFYPEMPMRVGFNTTIGYRILRDNYYGPGDTPVERECRRILLIAPIFEGWSVIDPLDGTPVPVPDPRDWETYKPMVMSAGLVADLYTWVVGDGLTKALRQAAGNS